MTKDEKKIYLEEMNSWDDDAGVEAAPAVQKKVATIVAATYTSTRADGAALPIPVAFGGIATVIAATAVATGEPTAAFFSAPFLVGALVFQAAALAPSPLTVSSRSETAWESIATPTMLSVRDDVTATRYFERVHMARALEELGLYVSVPPVLQRVEAMDDGEEAVLRLVFKSLELPFSAWERKVDALATFFEASSCSVTKVGEADRLVAVDISTRAAAVEEHSHDHKHDHAEEKVAAPAQEAAYSR